MIAQITDFAKFWLFFIIIGFLMNR